MCLTENAMFLSVPGTVIRQGDTAGTPALGLSSLSGSALRPGNRETGRTRRGDAGKRSGVSAEGPAPAARGQAPAPEPQGRASTIRPEAGSGRGGTPPGETRGVELELCGLSVTWSPAQAAAGVSGLGCDAGGPAGSLRAKERAAWPQAWRGSLRTARGSAAPRDARAG